MASDPMTRMLLYQECAFGDPDVMQSVWRSWHVQYVQLTHCMDVFRHTISFAYDRTMILAIVTVTSSGHVQLHTPDHTGRVHTYDDIVHGVHTVLQNAFACKWTFNDLVVNHTPLATSWLCAHLHHLLRLVDFDNVKRYIGYTSESDTHISVEHHVRRQLDAQGLPVTPELEKRLSVIGTHNGIIIDSKAFRWVPNMQPPGRPSKMRKVCIMTDLARHSPTHCKCARCAPEAEFPHRINPSSGKIEPLPINCHVCVNGTVAFDTPEGLFAIENFKESLKNARIGNMPNPPSVTSKLVRMSDCGDTDTNAGPSSSNNSSSSYDTGIGTITNNSGDNNENIGQSRGGVTCEQPPASRPRQPQLQHHPKYIKWVERMVAEREAADAAEKRTADRVAHRQYNRRRLRTTTSVNTNVNARVNTSKRHLKAVTR